MKCPNPDCPVPGTEMELRKNGVYKCPKCKGVFASESTIKSIFAVH